MKTRARLILSGILILFMVGGIVLSKVSSASDRHLQYTGQENHDISLLEAERIMGNFRKGVQPGTVIGGYFGKDALMSILVQPGAVGMRAYYAEEDDGSPTLVLFGVNGRGEDIVDGNGPLQIWFPCPPFCPKKDTVTSVVPEFEYY